MNKTETATTPRGRYNFRKSTRNLAEKITSFFTVRKRVSEDQSQSVTKKRRAYSPNTKCFTSPVSLAPTPVRPASEPSETLPVRQKLSPLRFVESLQEPSEFGIFEDLPTDVVVLLMNVLSYSDLGALSMTSKSWRNNVKEYMRSARFEKRWVYEIGEFEENDDELYTNQDPYYSLGSLVNQISTVGGDWDERLKALRSVIRVANSVLGPNSSAGCGRIINAFVKNEKELSPDDYESIIKCTLSVFGDLKKSLEQTLLSEKEDCRTINSVHFSMSQMKKELAVREEIHGLFLTNGDSDPMSEPNRYFLSSLFQLYKSRCRSLLFLLFSPLVRVAGEEIIHWHYLGEMVAEEHEEAQEVLRPVANVLRALLVSRKSKPAYSWTKNAVFNLIEEVTTYPSPWSMSTFVSVQLFQPCLIPITIAARVQKEYYGEVGDMICSMKTLLCRWNIDVSSYLSEAFDAMRASMTKEERSNVFTHVVNFFVKYLGELQQKEDIDEYVDEMRLEFQSMVALTPVLEKFID